MVHIPDIFFGAADRQMEAFLDRNAFERAFLLCLLFQGNLVITDTFFYMSSHLRAMLTDESKDWLTPALAHGAVVPYFRSDTRGVFASNFAEVLSQGIQGPTPEAGALVARLDSRMELSAHYRYLVWPGKLLGEDFYRISSDALLVADGAEELENEIFRRVHEVAREVIPDAASRGGGLRRAEVYNAIVKKFAIPAASADDAARIIKSIHDPRDCQTVTYLLKWVNYCYQFNQGLAAGLSPTLNSMNDSDLILASRLCRQASSPDTLEAVRKVIQFPSLAQFRTVPIAELLAVRDGEAGGRYFACLGKWQRDPTEETAVALVEGLDAYVGELKVAYLRCGKNILNPARWIEALIPIRNAHTRQVIRNTAAWLADSIVPPLGIVNLVRENVACTYTILPEKVKDAIDRGLLLTKKVEFSYRPEERRVAVLDQKGADTSGTSENCFN